MLHRGGISLCLTVVPHHWPTLGLVQRTQIAYALWQHGSVRTPVLKLSSMLQPTGILWYFTDPANKRAGYQLHRQGSSFSVGYSNFDHSLIPMRIEIYRYSKYNKLHY